MKYEFNFQTFTIYIILKIDKLLLILDILIKIIFYF